MGLLFMYVKNVVSMVSTRIILQILISSMIGIYSLFVVGGLSTNPSQTSLTASPTVALSPHHSPKMNMVHASNSADPGGVTMTPPVGPRGPHLRHLSESSTSSFGSARIQVHHTTVYESGLE